MNLKSFWERRRAQRWAATPAPPAKPTTPRRFEPLTRQESIAVLDDTIQWLLDEGMATIAMPNGPYKEHRQAELRARDYSIARDFKRLFKKQG